MEPSLHTASNPPSLPPSQYLHHEIELLVKRFDQTKQLGALQTKLEALNDKFWTTFAENDGLKRENRALEGRLAQAHKRIEELETRIRQGDQDAVMIQELLESATKQEPPEYLSPAGL